MKDFSKALVVIFMATLSLSWLVMWVIGAVMAKGFWSTFFAVCTGGIWSLYLILEKILDKYWYFLL